MSTVKIWWQSLAQRERQILLLGALVAIFVGGYSLLWQPLVRGVESAEQRVNNNLELLHWMQPRVKHLVSLQKSHQSQGQALTTAELLPTLEQALKQDNTLSEALQQISLGADDTVSLSFAEVPFDAFIAWLSQMKKEYQLKIDSLSVNRLATEGLVRLELRLQG